MTKNRIAASTAAAIVPAGMELLLSGLAGLLHGKGFSLSPKARKRTYVVEFPKEVVFTPPTRKARVRFSWLITAT